MTKQEFLNKITPLVVNENSKRNYPLFSSVVIGQACCETGYGKSNIMMKANAIFGIKATKTWKGKVYNSKTKECYDGVNYTDITACFRAYDSLEESIKDYFDLICKSSRYKNAVNSGTPEECITAIKNGGYATAPTYIQTIMTIINDNNLTKYDKIESVENVEKPVQSSKAPNYKIGNVYTLQVDLKVRAGTGINARQKLYTELSSDGKKHAYNQKYAVLKKGTKVTCKSIFKNGSDIWLQIPSGYVAGFYHENLYIK